MTWKPWPRDERYLVSDQGQIRGLKGRVLKPGPCGQGGYRKVSTVPNPNQRVDYMVLETFVGPRPEGHEVLHANDDQSDNRLENLRWGTHVENCQDRRRNGKHHVSYKYPRDTVRAMIEQGLTRAEILATTRMSRTQFWRIARNLSEEKTND